MKKIKQILQLTIVLSVTLLAACKKEFLNTLPVDQVPAAETWKDPALAEAFVNGIYGGLYEGGFQEEMLASFSDEAMFTHAGRNINTVNQGILSSSSPGLLLQHTSWVNLYN